MGNQDFPGVAFRARVAHHEPMKGEKAGSRTPAQQRSLSGDKRVRLWRRDRLRDMGFTLSAARVIADSPADLADVRALLERGCPHDTVRRIVL